MAYSQPRTDGKCATPRSPSEERALRRISSLRLRVSTPPDPYAFRIDRDPNPQYLGFGVGEHFCLGAHLARLDLRVFWRQFAERFESIELAGPVKLLHASFVGGPKSIPVRYKIRPARN